jgi:hypothetical protein
VQQEVEFVSFGNVFTCDMNFLSSIRNSPLFSLCHAALPLTATTDFEFARALSKTSAAGNGFAVEVVDKSSQVTVPNTFKHFLMF